MGRAVIGRAVLTPAAAAILAAAASTAAAQQPSCSQDHPGRQHRVESVAKRGDARMAWSAAAHATKYAVERYGLQGIVTTSQLEQGFDETYEFLKWKLGNPTAVATQFVSAGYQHFDRGYSDEAAAVLLGFELPKEKGGHSMFYIPPELVDLWMLTEKLKNTGKAYLLNAFFGIPKSLTKEVLDYIVEQEGAAMKRLGFNIPKSYDFPNELLIAAIESKKDPERLRARFLAAVEEAARYEQQVAGGQQPATIESQPSTRGRLPARPRRP